MEGSHQPTLVGQETSMDTSQLTGFERLSRLVGYAFARHEPGAEVGRALVLQPRWRVAAPPAATAPCRHCRC